jgi:hypothetical protein
LSFRIDRHLYESKTPLLPRIPVGYEIDTINCSIFLKQGSNRNFGSIEAEVSNKNTFHFKFPLLQTIRGRIEQGRLDPTCGRYQGSPACQTYSNIFAQTLWAATIPPVWHDSLMAELTEDQRIRATLRHPSAMTIGSREIHLRPMESSISITDPGRPSALNAQDKDTAEEQVASRQFDKRQIEGLQKKTAKLAAEIQALNRTPLARAVLTSSADSAGLRSLPLLLDSYAYMFIPLLLNFHDHRRWNAYNEHLIR